MTTLNTFCRLYSVQSNIQYSKSPDNTDSGESKIPWTILVLESGIGALTSKVYFFPTFITQRRNSSFFLLLAFWKLLVTKMSFWILPDLYIYILMQQRTYFLSYQNIIQFGCLTLPLLWLVTILFYAAGLSLPRVFMAFSLLFPEK